MQNNIVGKIIKINKDLYTVKTNTSVLSCYVRGKLRSEKLVVGDNVKVNTETQTIEQLEKRKNSLIRPLVSNIDKLFIVVSTEIPVFSEYLLDKMISLAEYNKIEPIIIITKLDITDSETKKHIKKIKNYYKKYYKVYTNKSIRKIKKEIKNNVVALCGQTGAGKSTLINKIDPRLNLKTDIVSTSLGRGKHTTRLVELIEVSGGLIADTPGFSALELDIPRTELKQTFIDFEDECKYKSCLHVNEEGCKVRGDVKSGKILKSRYDNYIKLLNDSKRKKTNKEW